MKAIDLFAEKIRNASAIDELIKVESFAIDKTHKGYLYAYKTGRGVHIETTVSTGTCDFETPEDMYCAHTLHEYLYWAVTQDKTITLENRIETLLERTIKQLDILAPLDRANKNATIL